MIDKLYSGFKIIFQKSAKRVLSSICDFLDQFPDSEAEGKRIVEEFKKKHPDLSKEIERLYNRIYRFKK